MNKLRIMLLVFTALCILLSACGGEDKITEDAVTTEQNVTEDSTTGVDTTEGLGSETDGAITVDTGDQTDVVTEGGETPAGTTNAVEITSAPETNAPATTAVTEDTTSATEATTAPITTAIPDTEEITLPIDTPITLPFIPVG